LSQGSSLALPISSRPCQDQFAYPQMRHNQFVQPGLLRSCMSIRRFHARVGPGSRRLTSLSPYVGVPLSDMSPCRRGFLLEDIARQHDELSGPFPTKVAAESLSSTGKRRCGRNAAYDWQRLVGRHHRRVESKSSTFSWGRSAERWGLTFNGVKTENFDDLVLAIYAPWGVELWEYRKDELQSSFSQRDGQGRVISIYGKRKVRGLEQSWLSAMHPKLSAVASRSAILSWEHPLMVNHLESRHLHAPYAEVPLATRSHACRNRLVSEVVGRVVRQEFRLTSSATGRIGVVAARCDSDMYKHAVTEVRTSSVRWDSTHSRWYLRFRSTRRSRCAQFFLVVYAPWGLDIWALGDDYLKCESQTLSFHGRYLEADMKKSFETYIRPKLNTAAQHVATMRWGDAIIQEVLGSQGDR